jgi:hypothetical protein
VWWAAGCARALCKKFNLWGEADSPKTHLVAMPTIKIRVRTPARQVMLDVDDGITVADLKKKVRARD